MNRIAIIGLLSAVVSLAGCSGADKPVTVPKHTPIGQPMEDPTPEKIEARVKKAGEYVLTYAQAHGGVLPKCDSTPDLVKLLKQDAGDDPQLQESFVAENGKTWLIYNYQIQGKKLSEISEKKQTPLMWNPLNFGKQGQCYVYVDGSTGWVYRMPSAAGG